MNLNKLMEIYPALLGLGATKLPAKAGYRIAKAINLVRPEFEAFEKERLKLAQSIGTPVDGDPSKYEFKPEQGKEFFAQVAALGEEEVDIKLPTVAFDELGDISIEPQFLAVLDGYIIQEAAVNK